MRIGINLEMKIEVEIKMNEEVDAEMRTEVNTEVVITMKIQREERYMKTEINMGVKVHIETQEGG